MAFQPSVTSFNAMAMGGTNMNIGGIGQSVSLPNPFAVGPGPQPMQIQPQIQPNSIIQPQAGVPAASLSQGGFNQPVGTPQQFPQQTQTPAQGVGEPLTEDDKNELYQTKKILTELHSNNFLEVKQKEMADLKQSYDGLLKQRDEIHARESNNVLSITQQTIANVQQAVNSMNSVYVQAQQIANERDKYKSDYEQVLPYRSAFDQANALLIQEQQKTIALNETIQQQNQLIQQLQLGAGESVKGYVETINKLTKEKEQLSTKVAELEREITILKKDKEKLQKVIENSTSAKDVNALEQQLKKAQRDVKKMEIENSIYRENGRDGEIQIFMRKNNFFECDRKLEASSTTTTCREKQHPTEKGKYIVDVNINDSTVKYVLLHDSTQLRNNRYLFGKVLINGSAQFVVSGGKYHVCGYNGTSLINQTFKEIELRASVTSSTSTVSTITKAVDEQQRAEGEQYANDIFARAKVTGRMGRVEQAIINGPNKMQDGTYQIRVSTNSHAVKFFSLHDDQVKDDNKRLQAKKYDGNEVVFVVPKGNYDICGYDEHVKGGCITYNHVDCE